MVREHGSLTKDAETNEAAWEAARGAARGAVKVCSSFFCGLMFLWFPDFGPEYTCVQLKWEHF